MLCYSEGADCEGYLDPWSLLDAFKRKSMSLGVDYITGEAMDFIQNQNGKISGVKVCVFLGIFQSWYPILSIRQLKQPRRRQQERHEFSYLTMKNNINVVV